VEALPIALTPEFYDDETKQKQWNAFVTKNKLYIEPISLRDVTATIANFVLPVLNEQSAASLLWSPGGPWMPQHKLIDANR
jgi:hypothetical protein